MTTDTETKKKATTRTVARKTIVMQMEVPRVVSTIIPTTTGGREEYEVDGVAWKDMTGDDFGEDPDAVVNQRVQVFKDSVDAKRRLRIALESGKLEGGTFRVASCGESMTPTVEQQQTNKVTM